MDTPNRFDEVSVTRTPNSTPERGSIGDVCPPARSLPLRLKASPPTASPESSPDRGSGGVRSSSAWELLAPTCDLDRAEPRSVHLSRSEDAPPNDHRSVSTPEQVPERSGTPEGGGEKDESPVSVAQYNLDGAESNTARLPPTTLPQYYFPDTRRSLSSPEYSPERPVISGDGAVPSLRGPLQEKQVPVAAQEPPSSKPPAHQPRPLPRRRRRNRFQRILPSRSKRRTLYHQLKLVALDMIFLSVFLGVTGIILRWAPLWRRNERLFPMTLDPYTGTWYGPRELSYPRQPFILGVTTAAVMVPLIPLAIIVLMQYWIRSWLDFNAAFFALKKAMVLMLFLQVILKSYIGEFRPFFISTCDPDPKRLALLRPSAVPSMSLLVFANPTYCRGRPKDVTFAMTSFPSGHTASSFMAGTFLTLYLNAKLKPFGDFHTSFWKMMAVSAPIIGAVLIAGSLVADRNHHHHDIILSIPIGVMVGLLAYRTHYASVFDYRTNHLPLPWSGTNESLNPTVPEPSASPQEGARNHLLQEKGNLAATSWPRKPKTYTYGNKRRVRETVPAQPGVDGANDRLSPAVLATGPTLRRRLGFSGLRRGRTRLALFPRQPGVDGPGLNTDDLVDSRPLTEQRIEGTVPRRVGVDSWANGQSRTGRASDMV